MNKLKTALIAGLAALTISPASAVTIIKFDLGSTGPDVQYSSGMLSTVDDGDATTAGDQNTGIDFVNFLDGPFSDILAGASISLSNIMATGSSVVLGTLVTQATTGGTFDVYDPSNNLLLSGSLGDGAITGSNADSTGSFFNTAVANFTSGSLLSSLAATPAGFSISFTNILSSAGAFMNVGTSGLDPFTADATGQIEGDPAAAVPEPATLALLVSGVLGGIAKRKKRA